MTPLATEREPKGKEKQGEKKNKKEGRTICRRARMRQRNAKHWKKIKHLALGL